MYNQFLTRFPNCMFPHWGGGRIRSLVNSILTVPNIKSIKISPETAHYLTQSHKNQLYNLYDQKSILVFRRGEQILLAPCKIGLIQNAIQKNAQRTKSYKL